MLKAAEKEFGPKHENVVESLDILASFYAFEGGKEADAVEGRARDIFQRIE